MVGPFPTQDGVKGLVPGGGLEPPRPCGLRILSPIDPHSVRLSVTTLTFGLVIGNPRHL
jgi:hypothetical protein